MSICFVFGAAEIIAPFRVPKNCDFVIAADAGYDFLIENGIKPDIAVGDFDSLGKIPSGLPVVRHPVEKDDTDMFLALSEGKRRGFKEFIIYGGTGGRLDHTLANIQCAARLSKEGASVFLIGDGKVITAFSNGKIVFPAHAHGTVSVFCHGSFASGVYERGLKYGLENARLSCDFPVGVSNKFTGTKSEISVDDGTLIVIYDDFDYFPAVLPLV